MMKRHNVIITMKSNLLIYLFLCVIVGITAFSCKKNY